MSFHLLDIDSPFKPLYGDQIIIPPNAIFWRGFDPKYPAVSDRPAYYGMQYIAEGYAEQFGVSAKPFISRGYLRLLDFRFLKVLLSQLFNENKPTKSDLNTIASASLAFGLCSLKHQVELLKIRYGKSKEFLDEKLQAIAKVLQGNNLIEQQGYRLGETTNDGFVMGFLKELMGGYVDGFISPRMYSPFHTEKTDLMFNAELIIFDPLKSGIELLSTPVPSKVLTSSINGFILHRGKSFMTIKYQEMETSFYSPKNLIGGSKTAKIGEKDKNRYILDYNYLIDIGHKPTTKLYNSGLKAGREWNKKTVKIQSYVAPVPTLPVSDFPDELMP